MAVIDSAYQYYLNTYGNASVSRYDTHKKSQLRAVYNNIIKTNKDSPLYKIKDSGDIKKFAIDVKERARSIQNVVASLSDSSSGIESVFSKKIAQSTDESTVSAEYIGPNHDVDDALRFDVEVKNLATPQINTGKYLSKDKCDFKSGSYSFELSTNLSSYEFQYNITESDTNFDIQLKLMRLINNAGVGLKADVLENAQEKSALQITSRQTGLSNNESFLFEILPTPDSGSIKVMNTLGIDQVTEMAQNSTFVLNGVERTSLSNTFTVNNAFELTLKQPSSTEAPVQIGFKANADAIADNIQSLVNVYNNMVQLGYNYSTAQQSGKLLHDMKDVPLSYYNELESIGLQTNEDGFISIDRNLLTDAVTSEGAKDCFSLLNSFKEDLNDKASYASIDPMNYVSKIIVTYKNPGHNFATPYITSIYSGMMMDAYC